MADQSDITSTTNTDLDSPPQVSFDADSPPEFSIDMEQAGKGKVPDEETAKKQKHGRSCLRRFFCAFSSICVLCLIMGSIIFFIVYKQPVLHTDCQNVSLTDADQKKHGDTQYTTAETVYKPSKQPVLHTDCQNASLANKYGVKQDITAETGLTCPKDWSLYKKRCYYFTDVLVHLSEMKEFCAFYGGVPVMSNIMTKEFREFIASKIRKLIGCCNNYMSVLNNPPSTMGNIDEAINRSLSILQDSDRNVMDIPEYSGSVPDEDRIPPPRQKDDTFRSLHVPLEDGSVSQHKSTDDPLSNSLLPIDAEREKEKAGDEQTRSLEPIRATSPHPHYGFWLGSGHDHGSDYTDGHTDQLPEDISNDINDVMTSHGRFDNDTDIPTSHDSFHSNADIMASPEGFDSTTDMTWLRADFNHDTDMPLLTENSDQELGSGGFHHPALSNVSSPAPTISTSGKLPDSIVAPEEADNNLKSARSVYWGLFCERYDIVMPLWEYTGCNDTVVQLCETNPIPTY